MNAMFLSATIDRRGGVETRVSSSWSKKAAIFSKKKSSEEWHQEIDFTAAGLSPIDPRFPWLLIRKHTDQYLKKKGKLKQPEVDIRLAAMIESHEVRFAALAACAHVMSPAAVRALLNVELNVAPVSFYGLKEYLYCLIAANFCNPNSVSYLESQWARNLIPYAEPGPGAAGRYLMGVCQLLKTTSVTNMNLLPDFTSLTRRAIKTFATQLEGLKLKCSWMAAHACTTWLASITQNLAPSSSAGQLLPEHLLDTQFPIWRVWASWKPNVERIKALDNLSRRGVLPDMLALEGPDFIAGKHATLRDGLIAQFGAAKPLVRFRSLIISVPACTKEELRDLLNRTADALVQTLSGGDNAFNLFVHLAIMRPITHYSLSILEAVSKIPETEESKLHAALVDLYAKQADVSGKEREIICTLVPVLDNDSAEALRKVLLDGWFAQGLERCVKDCQIELRDQIRKGKVWRVEALDLYILCSTLKNSKHCLPLLDAKLQSRLAHLPEFNKLRMIIKVYGEARDGGDVPEGSPLRDAIESYCIDKLIEHGSMSLSSERTVEALLDVFESTDDRPRQYLAILAAKKIPDFISRCQAIGSIDSLPDEFIREFHEIQDIFKREPQKGCVQLTHLLANAPHAGATTYWRTILYQMIVDTGDSLLEHSLQNFRAAEWSTWMLNLFTVFSDQVANTKIFVPTILKRDLHHWAQRISEYIPTLTRLEENLGNHAPAVQCLLGGGEDVWLMHSKTILDALTQAREKPVEPLMQSVTRHLTRKGGKFPEVTDCVRTLLAITPEGVDIFQRVLDSCQDQSIPIAVKEVTLAGWLQNEDVENTDKEALKALGALFSFQVYDDACSVPEDKLRDVEEFFDTQAEELLKEQERLGEIVKALKERDPHGTAILLETLGVQSTSPLDDELETLPISISNLVEKLGFNEVEMSFPLELTELRRSAMGIGAAKTLLIRFQLGDAKDMPSTFCAHLDTDYIGKDPLLEHTPCVCLDNARAPEAPYCIGDPNPFIWQVNRYLFRMLKDNPGIGIERLYGCVKVVLDHLPQHCIVCHASHIDRRTTGLRRSIPCTLWACERLWSRMPLEIRLPELRMDTFAVDLILTSVYAAALSGRAELLPGCPVRISSVTLILNTLPPLSFLAAAINISGTLKLYHNDAEKLLVWACTHYRGFITTATSSTRIPNLPAGTHQFLLASASPITENYFAQQIPKHNPQTRVLFHGTSLDRLPNILSQGLKVYSGTALQRTGAAHGKGIYMAEEPATSFSYSPSAVSWKNSGLHNMRLLLGCEVVGNGNSVSPGIHVIKEEKTVIVRYVFLFTGSAYAPNSNHVAPAMLSTMVGLRSGAL